MKRTDIHRPAVMQSQDYTLLAASFPDGEHNDEDRFVTYPVFEEIDPLWLKLGEPTKSSLKGAQQGRCDHCGARHVYQGIVLHVPTGDILSVGTTCAFSRFNRPEWKGMAAAAAKRAEYKARAEGNERRALAAMNDTVRAAYEWAVNSPKADQSYAAKGLRIAQDIASKVRQWGPLSDPQANFLVKLHTESLTPKVEEPSAPVITGRIEITGRVLTVKEVEVQSFGWRGGMTTAYKMLVRDHRGFKVWGTCNFNCDRNDEVKFTATVEASKDDATFGFFKRPTKGVNLTEAAPTAPVASERATGASTALLAPTSDLNAA